jgi:membrane-associated phospholipid phosphatase
MKHFLFSIPKNIIRCYTNCNWVWHIAAIALTFVLVTTNADWYYFLHMHSLNIRYFFFPALFLGGILPLLLPLYLLISGLITNTKIRTTLGFAVGQAALIGGFIAALYKAFTGRVQPNIHNVTTNTSPNFNFGFLKHGVFWGWPSSHTTIAFAMAFTLIKLFPANKAVKILCLLYALYIGVGVAFSIHWFSEFAAGAIIGSVVGIVVANSYEIEIEQSKS